MLYSRKRPHGPPLPPSTPNVVPLAEHQQAIKESVLATTAGLEKRIRELEDDNAELREQLAEASSRGKDSSGGGRGKRGG